MEINKIVRKEYDRPDLKPLFCSKKPTKRHFPGQMRTLSDRISASDAIYGILDGNNDFWGQFNSILCRAICSLAGLSISDNLELAYYIRFHLYDIAHLIWPGPFGDNLSF